MPRTKTKCGMVSVVGRPNVGKSTLVNTILQEKVAIVSKVAQTTRNQVRGIYNDETGQIIFIDTPGLHMSKDKLDRYMNSTSVGTMQDADCVIHLVDSSEPVGREEEEIVKKCAALKTPIVLGLNKIDLKKNYIPEYIELWEKVRKKPVTKLKKFAMLPLSGKKGTNVEKLIDILFGFLPAGPPLYPTDTVTDAPQKMVVSDVIREKLIDALRHEVPHALAVLIEEMKPVKRKTMHIRALILVERDSQKKIVIGKGGQVLKKTGSLARKELEDLLEQKVFLEVFVKVKKNWRDNNSLLEEMGYASL